MDLESYEKIVICDGVRGDALSCLYQVAGFALSRISFSRPDARPIP
jgi:hypothetical protein